MIDDDRPTYRERRQVRAERLRGWADKRETRGQADLDRAHQLADLIPFGQPILVGHHSEGRHRRDLARIQGGMERGLDSLGMAERMRERADSIERAAQHAVYNDDTDAIERLRERIALREAERDRLKAYNTSCRKGTPDPALLTPADVESLRVVARFTPYNLSKGGGFPAYALTNLGATIRKDRQRLEQLQMETIR